MDATVLARGDYVGVPTARHLMLPSPWVAQGGRTVGAQMGWAF
jgi:hypothetical protein